MCCINTVIDTQIIKIYKVCQVDLTYRGIFGPAERVRYMAYRLTSDISTKEVVKATDTLSVALTDTVKATDTCWASIIACLCLYL